MGTTVYRRQMAFTPIAPKIETIAHRRHLLSEFDTQDHLVAGYGNTELALVDSGVYSPMTCSPSSSEMTLKKSFPKSPHVNQYGTLSVVSDRRLSGIRTSPSYQLVESTVPINTDYVYVNDTLRELRKRRLHLKEQREILSENLERMQQKDAEIHENFFRLRHKRLLLDIDLDAALGCFVKTGSPEYEGNTLDSHARERDISPSVPLPQRKRPHNNEDQTNSSKKRRTSHIKREVNRSDRVSYTAMYTSEFMWNTTEATVFVIPPGNSVSPISMDTLEEPNGTPCIPLNSAVNGHGDTHMESTGLDEEYYSIFTYSPPISEEVYTTDSSQIAPVTTGSTSTNTSNVTDACIVEGCSGTGESTMTLQVAEVTPARPLQRQIREIPSPYRAKQPERTKTKSALEELRDLQNALNKIETEGSEVTHLEATYSFTSEHSSPASETDETQDWMSNHHEADDYSRDSDSNTPEVTCPCDTDVYKPSDITTISVPTLNPSSCASDGYMADASSDSTDDQSENGTESPPNSSLTLTPICNGLRSIQVPFPSVIKNTAETPKHLTPKTLESDFDEVSRYSIGCTLPGLTHDSPVPSSPQVIGCALPGLQRMRKRLARTSSFFAPRRFIQRALFRRRSDTRKH